MASSTPRKKPPKVNIRILIYVGRSEGTLGKFSNKTYIVAARGRRVFTAHGKIAVTSTSMYPIWLHQTTHIFTRYDDAIAEAETRISGQLNKGGYETVTKAGRKPSIRLADTNIFEYRAEDGRWKAATFKHTNDHRR